MPQTSLKQQIQAGPLPGHVAVIMDGNGRWAQARGLPRREGHRAGAVVVDQLLDLCLEYKIPVVSLYAFSTENWKRPADEIKALFELLDLYISDKLPRMLAHGIRLHISGDISRLPARSRQLLADATEKTRKGKKLVANFCLNYGGRDEILSAVSRLVADRLAEKGLRNPGRKPSAREFEKYLYTAGLPDVDLLIRTAGEKRLSNFLLYQSAYAELYFTDATWPEFDADEFYKSLIEFQRRNRKFGGLAGKQE